ncbi:hypothetical protein RCL_jg6542.t1 [Rhizophagus clarus]|uniref:Uncharacterized protein n=1 Tax=Rhizophagus clarus TaxID=94130 RepID=A0A8H3LHC9_9GLOM|nr:hypothetical protein RCL_jg6542.t1 [Rhizophagus clarus]
MTNLFCYINNFSLSYFVITYQKTLQLEEPLVTVQTYLFDTLLTIFDLITESDISLTRWIIEVDHSANLMTFPYPQSRNLRIFRD